ncbi:MAG: dihydroorotate dehydrogenase-like protein [Candidatus Sedimenticola endophacoides]
MDLTTDYLGLRITSPLIPSASPLTHSLDSARRLEEAGAGAIIMHSLFEESIDAEEAHLEKLLHHQETGFGEAQSFLPTHNGFGSILDDYLEQLRRLKEALQIPVVASLNGITEGGWLEHAADLEQAGADALELNVYFVPTDLDLPGSQVERRYLTLLGALRERIRIPINIKLSPYFSSTGHLVREIETIGGDGVALFNRFYEPDIDIESLRLNHRLQLSTAQESLLSMHWMALLYGRTSLTLGATSGVHSAADAIKLLLAGADVVHLCSLLLEQGPGALAKVRLGIEEWMEEKGFEDLNAFRGMLSHHHTDNPELLERINYLKTLDSYHLR